MVKVNCSGKIARSIADLAGCYDWHHENGELIADDTTTQAALDAAIAGVDEITTLKDEKIAAVYEKCQGLLDSFTYGYGKSEIALFPLLQDEIIAFNADNSSVGPRMQKIINRGRHTAISLSASVTPKIFAETSLLQARDNHVTAIQALTDVTAIENYNVNSGWS